jgi:hypothetical protein
MKNWIKRIFAKKKEKENTQDTGNYLVVSGDGGLDSQFLFDFKNYGSMYNGGSFVTFGNTTGRLSVNSEESDVDNSDLKESKEMPPQKIAIKPIDVLDQLETIPTPWTLSNLEDKIEVLKYKRDLIVQTYSRREVEGLIERLENRRKWEDFKGFFNEFQNTTDEKIEKLLDKYDLVMNTSDLFVPEFPDDAIAIMKVYTEKMEELCGKKPVFYVIAEPDKFRKAYERRDPILLVQSPFGFYWQILGAWDKEMILLSEL